MERIAKMADRETVITHLQIIRTWAAFARERDLQFFTATHLEKITQWADDALALLKDYDTQLQYCDDHITMYQAEIQRQDEKIKELQSAYDYLQKQFFEVQDKLLKEQEAVKPVLDEQTGRIWLCGKCGTYVGFEDNDPYDPNEFDKYCRECGRPVLWEGR